MRQRAVSIESRRFQVKSGTVTSLNRCGRTPRELATVLEAGYFSIGSVMSLGRPMPTNDWNKSQWLLGTMSGLVPARLTRVAARLLPRWFKLRSSQNNLNPLWVVTTVRACFAICRRCGRAQKKT